MSVLVTGARGFLGRQVAAVLREAGFGVVGLDKQGGPGEVDHQIDLTESVPEFAGRGPRTVVHLAGLAHVVPGDAAAGKRFFDVNVDGTRNLLLGLESARELPESLVFASTVAVYGLETGIGLDEGTPRRANDPYGESKRQAEDLIAEWGEQRGVRVGILRLPLAAGRSASGNLEAMVSALRRGRYLGVGLGGARRSMVLAEDVARALPRVAARGGVYHLTDGHHPSFRELETALCRALGRPEPRRLPKAAARALGWLGDGLQRIGVAFPFTSRTYRKMTSTLTFSDEAARRELGWNPRRVIDAAEELVS